MLDKRKLIPLGVVIILLLFWKFQQDRRLENYQLLTGRTMGPIAYNIKYLDSDERNYQLEVDSLLQAFNQSLSTYIPSSEISRFNSSDRFEFESGYFFPVLQLSKTIHQLTGGAFDPTVGPLVNAWGFGPGEKRTIDSLNIDSLKALVGFEKVSFDKSQVSKAVEGLQLDFSAIAKGYAVDVVGEFLEARGVNDYMVEIGGEVRCRGQNPEGKTWRIGIEEPTLEEEERGLFATVILEERSLATSGNYRNFYELDGKKYVHTISPFTGEPVQHSLLSASVFSKSCITADALATGFMVLGLERSLEIVNQLDSVDAYFIYADDEGELQTMATEGIEKMVR